MADLSEISIVRLMEGKGIKLRPKDSLLVGSCPFHPSALLTIDPVANSWVCNDCSPEAGTILDWIMKSEGVSRHHALELIKNDQFTLSAEVSSTKRSTVRKLPSPLDAEVDDQTLLQQVIAYYHGTLKDSHEALEFLENHHLRTEELIDYFKIGYCNRTLGYRLPEKNRRAGKQLRSQLQKLGILKDSGHELFRGSVVVPILDMDGHVQQIYGHKIRNDLRPGTPTQLYLPGPVQGILNIQVFPTVDEIILCESIIDMLTFWKAGIRHVTILFNLEELLTALQIHHIKRVILAGVDEFDAPKFMDIGVDVFKINLPSGQTVGQFTQLNLPIDKSLEKAIRQAIWVGKGKSNIAAVPVDEKTTITASPIPPLPVEPTPVEITGEDITLRLGDRRYRIRGLQKNLSYDQLKVNILITSETDASFHVDTFDLYSARQRAGFIKEVSVELNLKEGVIKKDLGKVLLELERLQDDHIRQSVESQVTEITMSDDEKSAALELLKNPHLLQRIVDDFNRCGLVGENTNKLIGYLAAVSRKLDEPLAVIVQSMSSAGKSTVMDAILAFVPPEDRKTFSAMTGQSLYYMGETDLQHKILAVVEEEGNRTAYALKLLQSEGELTIASTGKDRSGRLVTEEYRVKGPVMIFLTTTKIDIDEELLNRCIVLTVDESPEQTRFIHQLQRQKETLQGLIAAQQRWELYKLHWNAQRLLKPIHVVNPFAEQLTFMNGSTRTRRDHVKYLTLIKTVALLHQYQRTIQHYQTIEYIEVTKDDIGVANRLAQEVLGHGLDDLPPQTRKLLTLLDKMVAENCQRLECDRCDYRFTRKQVREYTEWGNTQVMVHLRRLQQMEYVLVHRGGRGLQFVYELLYQISTNSSLQLIDVHNIYVYDSNHTVENAHLTGVHGHLSGTSRGEKITPPLLTVESCE